MFSQSNCSNVETACSLARMIVLKYVDLYENRVDAGRSAAFLVLLASFCVRYAFFIPPKWFKEIECCLGFFLML